MAEGQTASGTLPPFLIKGRYGEPILTRIYNNLPVDRAINGGFGRNETQLHFHNAHNGAESDGAANVHHFPGTFYDYRWSTTLARRDKINTGATENRASGPDGNGGLVRVAGDFRELQGTMWAHDHRFFFTAENVYKGNLGMINYYSGPDRGNEVLNDGTNKRLPSGRLLDYGNTDFDVNLVVSDAAFKPNGQLFFDIFEIDGFLGDVPLVNFAYAPQMEVLPRKYRFRILNACMSRFVKLALAKPNGQALPFTFIANDGNFVVNPIRNLTALDQQGVAERYDIVVDFSAVNGLAIGDKVKLVNRLRQTDGALPGAELSLSQALFGDSSDPLVGPVLEFKIVSQVNSVDVPGVILRATDGDPSQVPTVLTEQIPVVSPVRTRHVEFDRERDGSGGDSRGPNGQCTPDCPEFAEFPWVIRSMAERTLDERQPDFSVDPQAGRNRALDLQRWRRLGSSNPSALRGRGDHRSRSRLDPEHGTAGSQGRVAIASGRRSHLPDSIRGIWRVVRQPLPQHGARGLRHADANPAPHRHNRIAADSGHADAEPDAGRRVLHHAGNPAGSRSEFRRWSSFMSAVAYA
jgi:hypothetical protein